MDRPFKCVSTGLYPLKGYTLAHRHRLALPVQIGTDGHTDRQRDTETERQRNRQTDKLIGRQTDRQRERERDMTVQRGWMQRVQAFACFYMFV